MVNCSFFPHNQHGNGGIVQNIIADAAEEDRFHGDDFRLSSSLF